MRLMRCGTRGVDAAGWRSSAAACDVRHDCHEDPRIRDGIPTARVAGVRWGRAILMRDAVQVPDTQADPGFAQRGTNAWHRSVLAVPLLRAGMPIGAIGFGRSAPGAFSAAQVELLKTFAEQAVIAISSAEMYRALQTRTADLQESLEYQTATSDVLKVISRSAFDLQPVLNMVGETAARLCHADQAVIIRREGSKWASLANFGFPPEYETYLKKLGPHRLIANAPTVASGRSTNAAWCIFTM